VRANGRAVRVRRGRIIVRVPAGTRQVVRLRVTGRDRHGRRVTRKRSIRVCG